MDDLKQTIANNIAFYRKEMGLTQVELAEKLNYSDKAISKWERAESYPDIATLVQLSKLFGVSLDRLVSNKKKLKRSKPLIALLSGGLVWLIATAIYVILNMIFPGFAYSWLSFVYAIPVCAVVLLVLFAIWNQKLLVLIAESILMWSVALCIFLTMMGSQGAFYIFFLPIPIQILAILWYCKLKTGKSKIAFIRHRVRNKSEKSANNTSNDDNTSHEY